MAAEPILVVGPGPQIPSDTAGLLKKSGYAVVEADTTERCLQVAKVLSTPLILVDMTLTDAYVVDLCRQIRETPPLSDTPLAVLGAEKILPESRTQVLEAGVDILIERPIPEVELLARLKPLLRIRKSFDRLKNERDRLAATLESAADAIITMDSDGRVLAWNRAAEPLFDSAGESARHKPLSEVIPFANPLELTDVLEKIRQELQSVQLDSVAVKNGETLIYLSVSVSPVEGPDGGLTGICMIARNMTAFVHSAGSCDWELAGMEGLSGPVQSSVTAGAFGITHLSGARPRLFLRVVERYGQALEHAWENRIYRVRHHVSEELRNIAEQLGQAQAGPRDIVQVHTETLKRKAARVAPAKLQALTEEGRLLLVELMGYLVTYYRNHLLGLEANTSQGAH